jgi:flagellin-like hook-associated protein FlgL
MVQAANDTNTFNNREMIQLEIDQIMTEINDVTFRTQFNTRTLLAGGLGNEGGGGQTIPVSLQWIVFQEARIIGLPKTGNDLLGAQNRCEPSIRSAVVSMQHELHDLARRVAERLAGSSDAAEQLAGNNMLNNLNAGGSLDMANIGANNMLQTELQQLRNITNRLDNLLRRGADAAEEVYRITQDQIRALGGTNSTNPDGSDVFMTVGVTDWSNVFAGNLTYVRAEEPGAAGSTLLDALNDVLDNTSPADGHDGMQYLNALLNDLVGYYDSNGERVNLGQDGTGGAGGHYNFIANIERVLDRSMNILADVNLESNAMWFQIGANSLQGLVLQLEGIHTGVLGGGRGDLSMLIDVRKHDGEEISEQLRYIDLAEGIVNGQRARLGAVQNRMEFTRQSLDNSSENLSAAESRIRDTDMAREMMRFTQSQVLQQAGISMLAQANQLPASILQLLQ